MGGAGERGTRRGMTALLTGKCYWNEGEWQSVGCRPRFKTPTPGTTRQPTAYLTQPEEDDGR
jgi:hypothetical protein